MNLYAAVMRLSATQDRAVVIKASTLTAALRHADKLRGTLIAMAPLVSKETYLEAVENVFPRMADNRK